MNHLSILFGTLCILLMILPALTATASSVDPETYSHDSWQDVLHRFVDAEGLVDYAALSGDRGRLDHYLSLVAAISPESHPELFSSREDRLAYLLNAYNALVFRGVLDLGPDANTVWGRSTTGYGFFVKQKVVLGGRQTNLRKLENQSIRREFEDPRIHAALNCASIGCPRLPRDAFSAEELGEQLEAAMAEFVNNETHCRVDEAGGTLTQSKIFDWFRSDFEEYEAAQGTGKDLLIHYLNRYRGEEDQIPLSLKVEFAPYDKALNRQ